MYLDFFRELKQYLDAETMTNMRLISKDIGDIYSLADLKERVKEERIRESITTKDFRCFGCKRELVRHIPVTLYEMLCNDDDGREINYEFKNEFGNEYECIEEIEGTKLNCITITHSEVKDYFVCPRCERYYIPCDNCSGDERIVLCQFIGHFGYKRDDENDCSRIYRFPSDDNIPVEIIEYCEKIGERTYQAYRNWKESRTEKWEKFRELYEDEDVPSYNVEDKFIFYFETKGWLPTGPDGGYCHFWRCLECGRNFSETDK